MSSPNFLVHCPVSPRRMKLPTEASYDFQPAYWPHMSGKFTHLNKFRAMVQRTTRQTEGAIVNMPSHLGGAFWIASAIMAMNTSRRNDNGELPMDYQVMCVVAKVVNETFEAACQAESQGRLTDDWMHPAFNDMMVAIWYGFPPTHEGVKQLERHFGSLHVLMQWDGMPGPAMSVDADWNQWARHSSLTFGLDHAVPGTLYRLGFPLFNMEDAHQLHLHRYAYLMPACGNEVDVDMEDVPIPFWETENDGDRLPLPPQQTPLDPSLVTTLSWAPSSGARTAAALSPVGEASSEHEVPVGEASLVHVSSPAGIETDIPGREWVQPRETVPSSKTSTTITSTTQELPTPHAPGEDGGLRRRRAESGPTTRMKGPLQCALTKGDHVTPQMKTSATTYTKEKTEMLKVIIGGQTLTKDHIATLKNNVGCRITLDVANLYLTLLREALVAKPDVLVCNMKVSQHCRDFDDISWRALIACDPELEKMEHGTWKQVFIPWREDELQVLDAIICLEPAHNKVGLLYWIILLESCDPKRDKVCKTAGLDSERIEELVNILYLSGCRTMMLGGQPASVGDVDREVHFMGTRTLSHASEADTRYYDSSLAGLCYLDEMARAPLPPKSARSMIWARGMAAVELLRGRMGQW